VRVQFSEMVRKQKASDHQAVHKTSVFSENVAGSHLKNDSNAKLWSNLLSIEAHKSYSLNPDQISLNFGRYDCSDSSGQALSIHKDKLVPDWVALALSNLSSPDDQDGPTVKAFLWPVVVCAPSRPISHPAGKLVTQVSCPAGIRLSSIPFPL
jgi:hypothetical protein